MKKPKKTSRLFEGFMDEYTGKAEARRVREEAAKKAKKGTVDLPPTRSLVPSMSTYRVQALEQENHALRLQLAAQQMTQIRQTASTNEFEQEYNRPEPEPEEAPRGRKIVLEP